MSRPVDPELIGRVPMVRRLLAGLVAISFGEGLLLIAQIGLLSSIVVTLFHGNLSWSSSGSDLLLLALTGTGRAGLAALREWLGRRGSASIRADLRARAATALTRLGPGWLATRSSGDLATEIGPGLDRADGYLSRSLPALTAAMVIPPLLILRLFAADWQSGLVVILLLPLVPVFMALIGVTTRRHTLAQHDELNRLAGRFLDLVQGLTTLRVYGRAQEQQQAVLVSSDRYRRSTLEVLKTALLSGVVLELLTTLSIAVVAVDVGLRVDHDSLGLEVALLVLLLLPEIFAPVRNMGAQYHANLDGQTAIGSLLALLAAADDLAPVASAPSIEVLPTGRVHLRDVRVHHAGRTSAALDLDDLELHPGEIVAVTGRSGAGKSTLLSVLLGFVEPTDGAVLVDTARGVQPLRGLDLAEWRTNLAWVPQHPRPSQASVGEEVRLGDPQASDFDVDSAIAHCHALPASTALEEDGRNTSAGQRRRIALARAVLRARAVARRGGVPLVLLDEPSEDLDRSTERVVSGVIENMAGWASVVMVTHSHALADIADRELHLDCGRLVADLDVRHAARLRPAADAGPFMVQAEPAPRLSAPATIGNANRKVTWSWRDLVRPARRALVSAVLLACLAGLAGLALMATSNWLILRAGEHPNVQALSIAVVGVRLFALVRPLARYAERLTGHDAALRLMASLRSRVFAALVPLVPLRGADLRRGELLRNFVADVDGVQDGVVRLVVPLAGAAATVTGAAAVGALIDPLAGLVVFVGLALAFVVAIASGRFADVKTGASLAAAAGERDRIATALVESLPELTVYGASAQAVNSLVDADETIRSAARSEALAAGVGTALTGGITAMTLAATLATAARDGLSGPSVGALAACVLVGAEAVGAVPAAVSAYGRLKGQLDRVMQLLSRDPSRRDPLAPQGIPSGSIGLTGAAITLAPQADAPAVLTDASVQVRPGQRTVVVGPSGSGKSTLLTSMLGLIPVSDGTLDINGSHESVALDDVAELDLRPRVAGSLQGDHVFDVSLRDNLRFVRPTADDAELETVAIRAGLSSFIAELPDGWDTRAGIDGSLLSGGQRQRLLIARALLADPDILVLDEPTAHLDEETERAVLTDLFAATGHRTLVMSSHRAAALVGASAVAHVVDGTIRQAEVPPTPPTKAEHKTETRPRHD